MMKKYVKYIIGGLTFFLIMSLFDYIFKFGIGLKINISGTIIYLMLSISWDYFFGKK